MLGHPDSGALIPSSELWSQEKSHLNWVRVYYISFIRGTCLFFVLWMFVKLSSGYLADCRDRTCTDDACWPAVCCLALHVLILQCLLHDTSLSDSLNVGSSSPSFLPPRVLNLPILCFHCCLETGHLHGSPCEKSLYQNYSFRWATIDL